MVFTQQIRHSVMWLLVFFAGTHGSISRDFTFVELEDSELTISTDASPWGIGGVLSKDGVPIAWFTDSITKLDLRRFRASLGDSALTTLWEVLALLVALRLWASRHVNEPCIRVKADSMSALKITLYYSSKILGSI